MEFKQILFNLRTNKDMTQEELSSALGITKQALSHYERGTRYPKPETLFAIADFLNVDIDYLTGRSSLTSRLLNSEEIEMIDAFRSASEDTKNAACAVLGITRKKESSTLSDKIG